MLRRHGHLGSTVLAAGGIMITSMQTLAITPAQAAVIAQPVPASSVSTADGAPSLPSPSLDPSGGPLQWFTATSRSIRNVDGSVSTYLYTGPTYHQVAGRWAQIDPTLSASVLAGLPFAAGQGLVATAFGDDASRLVSLTLPGGTVTLSSPDLSVSTPTLDPVTNTVSYDNAAPDTSLQLTSTNSGVQQKLVLASADAPTTFHFHLSDPSGALSGGATQPDGSFAFTGPEVDGYRLVIPAAGAYVPSDTGLDAPDPNSMTMTVTPAGDGYDITESLKADWLAGKTYPIVVDPDLYWDQAHGNGPADCFVWGSSHNSSSTHSFCNGSYLAIGSNYGVGIRSLLQFDTSAVPAYSTINDAYLGLDFGGEYYSDVDTPGSDGSEVIDVYRNGQYWDTSETDGCTTWVNATCSTTWSGTLDYPNEPVGGGDPVGDYDPTCQNNGGSCILYGSDVGWRYPRFMNTVQSWVTGSAPDEGVVVSARSADAYPPSPYGYFWTIGNHNSSTASCPTSADPYKASGCQPYAYVNYSPPSPPPAPTGVYAQASSQVGCAQVSWNPAATASGYEVDAYDQNNPYAAYSSASTTATSLTMCSLTYDDPFYFYVYAYNGGGYSYGAGSNTVTIKGTPPAAPTSVHATAGDKSVTATWSAVSRATGYVASLYSTTSGWTGQSVTTSGTTANFGGLVDGQSYYVGVQAESSDGTSAQVLSNTVTPAYTGPRTPTETAGYGGQTAMRATPFINVPSPGGSSGTSTTKLGCHKGQPKCAEPVDLLTGNMVEQLTDLAVPGRGLALGFTRTYNGLEAASASAPGPLGYGWSGSYSASLSVDATSGVVTVTQDDGSTITFTPSGSTYTAAPWVLATLAKNPDGSYTMSTPDGTGYTFNAAGQLVSETDRNGYSTTLGYSGAQLSSVTDPEGRSLAFTYDGSNRLTGVADPAGRTVAYGYDSAGNLASVTDPAGSVTSYGYDTAHRIVTITDPNGNTVLTNSYDTSNRVVKQVDALGRTTSFSYGSTSLYPEQTVVTAPDGSTTTDGFDNGFLIASTVISAGGAMLTSTSQGYDAADNITSMTDGDGHTTTMSYDAAGNPLTVRDPDGYTSRYSYDTASDLLSSTDPAGVTTSYSYDAAGNLLSVSTPDSETGMSSTTTFSYTDGHPGDVTAITDPNGHTTTISYTADGMPDTVTDPDGHAVSYHYANPIGWLGATTGAGAASYTYDGDGRPLTVTDADNHVTHNSYDADGNLTKTVDADGNVTVYSYDKDNEATAVTSGYGTSKAATESASYDQNGNLASQTSGRGYLTSYASDALGRITSVTDPDRRTTNYFYDHASQLLTVAAPGVTSSYGYDADGRLTSIGYSDATPPVSYGYDADGRRTSMTDGTGTASYRYNSLGQLTSSTDGTGATVTYRHDAAGQLAAIGYPGGTTVQRGYDRAGNLTSVTDWLGETTSFGYDAHDNLTAISYPNTVTESYSYDPADNLTSVRDTAPVPHELGTPSQLLLAGDDYTRDNNGQVTTDQPEAVTGSTLTPPADSYAYTPLNQLASAATTKPSTSISCDAATACPALFQGDIAGPNPYSYNRNGDVTGFPDGATLAYDQADQLASITLDRAVATFTYNSRGDRTGVHAYGQTLTTNSYNGADQLTAITTSDLAATYTYNGDGLRATATTTVNGTSTPATTTFSYDLSSGLPLILTDGTNNYIYGPDGLPIEQIGPDNTKTRSYLGHDQQGSTRILIDSTTPTVTGSYDYTPYGNTIAHTGADTPLQYDGQYHDPTGLYYLRARYYDPTTTQFLTVDPLEAVTGAAYNYADGDPIDLSDPLGLCGGWTWVFCETEKHVLEPVAHHWKTVVEVAGVTLTLVAVGASVVATGGLTAPLEFEIAGSAVSVAIKVAAVADAGTLVTSAALAASDCRRNALGPACAVDVAQALIGAGYARYSEQGIERVLGKTVARQIGIQQGQNISTLMQAARIAHDRTQHFGC